MWREGGQRQRVDRLLHIVRQRGVDETVALDGVLAGKQRGHHRDPVMPAAGGRSGVAGVQGTLVDDPHLGCGQGLPERGLDAFRSGNWSKSIRILQ